MDKLRKIILSSVTFITLLFAFFSLPQVSFAQTENINIPKIVTIEDNYFDPKTVTIVSGQKVIWVNKGKKDHTVTSNSGDFDSEHIAPGDSFGYVFTKPGIYKYSCSIHSFLFFGMKGKVIVQ